MARSFEKSPRMESRSIVRRPALLSPARPLAQAKLLPETSARGNGNLSGGAGLQTRRTSASFAPKTRANAPLSAQVLELHRRQDTLRPPGRPLHPVDGRRDRRGGPAPPPPPSRRGAGPPRPPARHPPAPHTLRAATHRQDGAPP